MNSGPDSSFGATLKRVFDLVAASGSLILLLPIMLLIGLIVRLSSPGPALFRQTRVGKAFQPFTILKFRTMNAGLEGPSITVAGDPRVTGFGRFLRSFKLDELPQLINVLRGEMSLVGPRPELPHYVELFRHDYTEILSVRPGITDFASFQYRDEELMLAHSADPEWEYANVILPVKVELGKRYVRRAGFAFDLGIILKTILELIWHRIQGIRRLLLRIRRPLVVVLHTSMAVVSYYLAWWFRFDGAIPAREQQIALEMLPLVLAIRAITLYYFRLYQGLWRFTDIWDVEKIFLSVLTGQGLVVLVVRFGFGEYEFPRAVYLLDAMLLMFGMVTARLVWRAYVGLGQFEPNLRSIIVGPHSAAALLALALRAGRTTDRRIVGLVDVHAGHVGLHIHGIPVIGSISGLRHALHKAAPDEVLVVGDLDDATRKSIDDNAIAYGAVVRQAPDLTKIFSDPAIQAPAPVRLKSEPAAPAGDAEVVASSHAERQLCLHCGAIAARRTRTTTLWERGRRLLTSKRPFRCEACKRRYWMEPTLPRLPELPTPTVDLAAIDNALQAIQSKADRNP